MDEIKRSLTKILQELIGEELEISEDVGFFDMGISSLTIATLCEKIKEEFGIDCDETDIFNYSNIEELAGYINTHK